MLSIVHSKYLENFKIFLEFNTKEKGVVDLENYLKNEKRKIFSNLKNINFFKNYTLDYTLKWGDVDFAPEFLYYQAFKNNPQKQELFKKWGYIKNA